jgi:proline dehydrogenase
MTPATIGGTAYGVGDHTIHTHTTSPDSYTSWPRYQRSRTVRRQVYTRGGRTPSVLPPVARRFVAGETMAEALDYARRLNADGLGAIVNLLGEHHGDPEAVAADIAAYERLVADIGASDLRARVSVKPTQLGLHLGDATFRESVDAVAAAAADAGVFLWLDMEGSTTTEPTLAAFERLAERDGDVGVCVQANLRRTPADIERLAQTPGNVRVVRGAYDEPAERAHQTRAAVDDAFRECLETAFREFDDGVAVATHDERMLEYAAELGERYGTDYEVQMLMGVREGAQRAVARDHPVWQYVPYGPAWLAYFTRRVAERRENLTFALRAVLGR